MSTIDLPRNAINELAQVQGLLFVGVAKPSYPNEVPRLTRWLQEGKNAGMAYLNRHGAVRADPSLYFESARSILVFALPYGAGEASGLPNTGVAQYARYPDYHRWLKQRLDRLATALNEQLGDTERPFRVAVDTAPVLERALAAQAPRGFIGKNTLWIHPEYGSYFLLGEIFTGWDLPMEARAEIPLDRKTEAGGCGPCRQCQVHCPTGALNDDYQLDARKCLSYWTIEHRGPIPVEFWPHLGTAYFGCDLCQTACPYNIKPRDTMPVPSEFVRRSLPELFGVATMDSAEYQSAFGGTPMTRARREGLRRNALIAMAVTRHPRLSEALERVRTDGGFPLEETVRQIREFLS